MIARVAACDMIAHRDRELISAPTLSQDATDSNENAEPMLSTDPKDPMLRMEPADPMLAIESTEPRDAYESAESVPEVGLAMSHATPVSRLQERRADTPCSATGGVACRRALPAIATRRRSRGPME